MHDAIGYIVAIHLMTIKTKIDIKHHMIHTLRLHCHLEEKVTVWNNH